MKDIFPKTVGAEVFLLGNIILGLADFFHTIGYLWKSNYKLY